MGDIVQNDISCSGCGQELDPTWAHMSPRPPCPACGGFGIAVHLGIASEVDMAGSINIVMQPQKSDRDWRRRWAEIESEWTKIDRPYDTPMSGHAIHSAHHRLQSFYIQAFHLKDSLIADASTGWPQRLSKR